MQVMGTNTWEADIPEGELVKRALRFAEEVRVQEVAQLRDAWIAPDEKRLWCTWDTENLEALEEAFDQMNKQSGLKSVLTPIETFYP